MILSTRPSITVTFTNPVSYVGFAWSTPDRNNEVNVYDGSTRLGSLFGSDVVGGGILSIYTNIHANSGQAIAKLVLSDLNETGLGCCFESDNYSAIPSSVPAPTAGAGLPSLIFASFGSRLGLSAKRYAGRSFAHSSMSPLIVGDDGGACGGGVLGRD